MLHLKEEKKRGQESNGAFSRSPAQSRAAQARSQMAAPCKAGLEGGCGPWSTCSQMASSDGHRTHCLGCALL